MPIRNTDTTIRTTDVNEYLNAIANDDLGIIGVGDIIATREGIGTVTAVNLCRRTACGIIHSTYRILFADGSERWDDRVHVRHIVRKAR